MFEKGKLRYVAGEMEKRKVKSLDKCAPKVRTERWLPKINFPFSPMLVLEINILTVS